MILLALSLAPLLTAILWPDHWSFPANEPSHFTPPPLPENPTP
jgi:hypothetical protein